MSKKKRKFRKSKAERRSWWYSLTPEQQDKYIKGIVEKKAKVRLQKSKKFMKKLGKKFDCNLCIHKLTQSCTDERKEGCEYFFDAKTGSAIRGK